MASSIKSLSLFVLLGYIFLEIALIAFRGDGILLTVRGKKWIHAEAYKILTNFEEFCLEYSVDNDGNFPEIDAIEKNLSFKTISRKQIRNTGEWIYFLRYLKRRDIYILYSPFDYEQRKHKIVVACLYDKETIEKKMHKKRSWVLLIGGIGVGIIDSVVLPIPGGFVKDNKIVYPFHFWGGGDVHKFINGFLINER